MRRSTLQRKDRSELNQIATALGAKPSSRARKDEIIQLIMDLTSGGASAAPPATGEDSEADAGATEHSRDVDTASAESPNSDTGNGQPDGGARNDQVEKASDDQRANERGGGRRRAGQPATAAPQPRPRTATATARTAGTAIPSKCRAGWTFATRATASCG